MNFKEMVTKATQSEEEELRNSRLYHEHLKALVKLFTENRLPKPEVSRGQRPWLLGSKPTTYHCPFDHTPLKGNYGAHVDFKPASEPCLVNMSGYWISHYVCPKCDYEYAREGF